MEDDEPLRIKSKTNTPKSKDKRAVSTPHGGYKSSAQVKDIAKAQTQLTARAISNPAYNLSEKYKSPRCI